MTREEIVEVWTNCRAPKKARQFVLYVAKTHRAAEEFKYLIGHMTDRKSEEGISEFYDLRKLGLESPMTFPYFFVRTDGELMHVRLVVSKMVAYELATGKKVIR